MNASPVLEQTSLYLLRNARYDELEDRLSEAQNDFEEGRLRADEINRLFSSFNDPEPALGEQLGQWLTAFPQSYAGHTALASWLLARAWAFRGHSTMNLVSDQGVRGMHHFLEQAEVCARQATTLNGNPLSAWLVVANVHNTQGCEVTLDDIQARQYPDWYSLPAASNPHSLEIRRAMLMNLRAEWGGSEEQMLAYVRQQQDDALLSQTDLQKLWGQFHARVAHHAWMFAQLPGKAQEHARLAAELDDRQTELLFGFLSDQNFPADLRQDALERYLDMAEREIKAGTLDLSYAASGLLGSVDLLRGHVGRVGHLLGELAGRGYADAASTLGALQHTAPHLPWPNPLPLLYAARDKGDVRAAEMAVHLQTRDTETITPSMREDILKAAELGSGDMSWMVYRLFPEFQEQFELDERARYRFLLRAADAGNNAARFALAYGLRAGRMEMGEDGVLRPVDTAPIQASLDYARHLLERAAAEDHRSSAKTLKKAREQDWDSGKARRVRAALPRSYRPQRQDAPHQPIHVPWFLMVVALSIGVKACSSMTNNSSYAAEQASVRGTHLLEQIIQQAGPSTDAARPTSARQGPSAP